jgi:polar amino acid transport system substrate-binding protein
MKHPGHRKQRIFTGVMFISIFMFQAQFVLAENKLVIGTSYKMLLSTPAQDGMLDRIAKEVFRRVGYGVELPYLPAERSLMAVNDGLHDGELNRIEGMEKLYPNLVRIKESMMDFQFVGFTKKISVQGGRWENLKPHQIGLIKGWKILEKNVGNFPKITFFHSAGELFQGLELGRVDVILYGKLIGLAVIKELNIQDLNIIQPPFATRKMYMYLHKKHEPLLPKAADGLRQMKLDGTYDEIVSKSLAPYLKVMKNEI